LSQYDFQIKYNQGKYNAEADCLSRNPVLEPHENEYEQLKIVNTITLDDILQDQNKNEYIKCQQNKLIKKHDLYYRKIKKKLFYQKSSA